MKQAYPLKYRDIIETQAEKYSIDPAFLYGMIRTESNFNPDAESSAGARGLMQITEVTFDRGGRIYHGRVKALADGARNAGLKF